MTHIRQIELNDVQRLTSGQVIIDLTTAIKELIDNSIDAHASQIDILFKNYGVDSVECSDNGDGIDPQDYESLAKRHYTSKIASFEDVYRVSTLGFRGEALSSLCSIGNLEVITTQTAPKAIRLEYDSMGNLTNKHIVSRNKGTTVQVTDLFNNLPVRRKEFVRTSRRQFSKTISLLQSYAMIQEKVRITVSNVTQTGKKSIILATRISPGKPNPILQNVKSIFGSSSGNILDSINLTLDLNPFKEQITRRFTKLHEDLIPLDEIDYKIKIEGYISKNSFGCGRNTKDRQYIYINKRPIEYPSLVKCCNEIYRSFNNVQYPFVVLNFIVNPQLIDINVTPDKRMILLHNEQYVIDVFKDELMKYYQGQELQLPKSNTDLITSRFKTDDSEILPSQELDIPFIKDGDDESSESSQDSYMKRNDNLSLGLRPSKRLKVMENVINVTVEEPGHEPDVDKNMEEEHLTEDEDEEQEEEEVPEEARKQNEAKSHKRTFSNKDLKQWKLNDSMEKAFDTSKDDITTDHEKEDTVLKIDIDGEEINYKAKYSQDTNEIKFPRDKTQDDDTHASYVVDDDADVELNSVPSSPQNHEINVKVTRPISENEFHKNLIHRSLSLGPELKSYNTINENTLETTLDVSGLIPDKNEFSSMKDIIEKASGKATMIKQEDTDIENDIEYMNLSVNKKEFAEMEIVGQFNLGFIIVIRKNGKHYDLFIVDQHASDEKYNFETLQRETIIACQTLITPQPLELNIIEEFLILDNLSVFQTNGFKLKIDEDEEPGHKISLLSVPISKQTVFDINDFNELVQLVKENDGSNHNNHKSIRCSKLRSLFAMRACRMSIMIGKPLTQKTMNRVVHNLSGLDKPWNCPHGRPTMRHLMELKDWKSFTDDYEYL